MPAQEKSFSSPARSLTVWDSWFVADLSVLLNDSLAALPQNLGWCFVCQAAYLNPRLGKQKWCQGTQNHQAGLKIMRLKLESTGERLYIFLKLLWKPFLVHEVTVKQMISEKKENQNYMDSIVLPINCSTNLGNQSYFGQR